MTQRRADLTPPLGWAGGPCKVVERIEDTVRVPALRSELSEKVEHGVKLTNPEAAKVYTVETERGGGLVTQMRISPHAQYRMDQRAITVGDLRSFFMDFTKKLNDWKSQKAWEYGQYTEDWSRGDPIEWTDKKLGDLKVVFVSRGPGVADIVTTYFQGEPDPRPGTCGTHPQHVHTARDVDDMSPVRTLVKSPNPSKSDTDKPQGESGKYPTQGLPEPWSRSKPTKGPTVLNTPGESGSNSDGNIHEDKVRTKGTPGGQYDGGNTHPTPDATDSQITPNRRPGLTAEVSETDIFDGMDPALIAEIVRLAGMYPPAYPGASNRHKKQRGDAYRYFHHRYQKQRGTIIRRQKQRYKRLINNGNFQADRERRRKHPDRFKTQTNGGASTLQDRNDKRDKKAFVPVPFYHYATGQWGQIIEVSPLDEVIYQIDGRRFTADLESFMDEVIIQEERLDDFEAYLDQVFDYDPADEDAEGGDQPDTLFDAWLQGTPSEELVRQITADFLRDQRPPDMAAETKYDRANNHGEWNRRDRERLDDISEYSTKNEGNPGSRVLPDADAGHVEKRAALISDIQAGCSPSLQAQGRKLSVRLKRVDTKNALWLFDVEGSTKDPYRIRLQAIRQGNTKALGKAHVRVSCSCPFWQWQGPEHWAKQGDYLYGSPRGLATRPDTKDHQGQHKACKHVLAVLGYVSARNWDLPELRGKTAGLQYLADTLDRGEVFLLPTPNQMIERVAARYLASLEVL